MANTNMPGVANSVASPATLNKLKDGPAATVTVKDTATWTSTTAGDTLLLCRIPVSATLDSLRIQCDDLGAATHTFDIGFYKTDANITVVDLDALATAVDASAAIARTEFRYEVKDHNTINQRVWELAGLSTEPDYGEMYIAMTVKVAATPITDADVSFYCDYTL